MSDKSETETSNVGPIIFADETARNQLLEEGEVVTFRKTQRTTGDTWWRKSRTGPKKGDVHVEEIGEVEPTMPNLEPYRELSGFRTEEDWVLAISELNGEVPETGHLYRATLQNETLVTDGGTTSETETQREVRKVLDEFKEFSESYVGEENGEEPTDYQRGGMDAFSYAAEQLDEVL